MLYLVVHKINTGLQKVKDNHFLLISDKVEGTFRYSTTQRVKYGTFIWICTFQPTESGFGGLEVACWPLVPKFAGSNPTKAVGFFRAKKSSARLPSDAVDLQHVKDPWMLRGSRAFSGKIHRPFLAQIVPPFSTRVSGGDTWRCK